MPSLQFHTFNVLSFDALANRLSSGKKQRSLIQSPWPERVRISSELLQFHSLIVVSSEPVANILLL